MMQVRETTSVMPLQDVKHKISGFPKSKIPVNDAFLITWRGQGSGEPESILRFADHFLSALPPG